MRKTLLRKSAVAFVSAVSLAVTALLPASASVGNRFSEKEFGADTDRYMARHPGDWLGLKKVWARHGVKLLSVSEPRLGLNGVSAEKAHQAVAAADRAVKGHRAAKLTADTFHVSGAIGQNSQGKYVVQGNWDFKDSFAGGVEPDDIAVLSVRSKCWYIYNTAWSIYDVRGGAHDNLGYLMKNNLQGDIAVGVQDRALHFMLLSDHGSVRHFMSSKGCLTRDLKAAFSFEHNQGGSTVHPLEKATGTFR
ncbi:hypothetical protein [Streptomyces sp. PA5.6]|uniref:hypothetical protein n=1 Tax=Streptomyces sp. PA5.6 TaxID=3035651 RepID=UPI0039049747